MTAQVRVGTTDSFLHDPLVVAARDVSVSFGGIGALSGVSLEVRPGELVVIAGENGAGKSSLLRCLSGDLAPDSGGVTFGSNTPARSHRRDKPRAATVWQDHAICDNLDLAANLALGRERQRFFISDTDSQVAAAALLARLGIFLGDTSRPASSLSGGERQLLLIARAIQDQPDLLFLDEPTASLGRQATAQVEALIASMVGGGTAVVFVSHDIAQMFRLAHRIVVLRHGTIAGEVRPSLSHPDEVAALMAGQRPDRSARSQLTRLHGLVDQLSSAEPASGVSLILSSLAAALGTAQFAVHVPDGTRLRCAGSLGVSAGFLAPYADPDADTPIATAVREQTMVIAEGPPPGPHTDTPVGIWAVPLGGGARIVGALSVFRPDPTPPSRDQLDLVTLYAGYAAAALERDTLLSEATTRNRMLETIREMLEALTATPNPPGDLTPALATIRRGLEAHTVAVFEYDTQGRAVRSDITGPGGSEVAPPPPPLCADDYRCSKPDATRRPAKAERGTRWGVEELSVTLPSPKGSAVVVARWAHTEPPAGSAALLEDAAHSLLLAMERAEAESALRESAALRRSKELQGALLSRLSHELRTPLTAIRGYASSLLQPDVTWDEDSERRFIGRIESESARLGRLVDDLLDYSAIESGIFRLQRDWCDLRVVTEAAIACLPSGRDLITVAWAPETPPIWADHDRLEQVLVNLLDNALRHNPPGTKVRLEVDSSGADVVVDVVDDGGGVPPEIVLRIFEPGFRDRPRSRSAGLGLSISKSIVEGHGGTLSLISSDQGARFRVVLPTEGPRDDDAAAEGLDGRGDGRAFG